MTIKPFKSKIYYLSNEIYKKIWINFQIIFADVDMNQLTSSILQPHLQKCVTSEVEWLLFGKLWICFSYI